MKPYLQFICFPYNQFLNGPHSIFCSIYHYIYNITSQDACMIYAKTKDQSIYLSTDQLQPPIVMHKQVWVFAKARYETAELQIEPQREVRSMRTDIVFFPSTPRLGIKCHLIPNFYTNTISIDSIRVYMY